ncbi:MAG: hypothetical protein ACTS10_13960 [Kiloniellales bacterium]
MSLPEILQLLGVLVAAAGLQVAVAKWILTRIAAEARTSEQRDKELHARIDRFNDTHMRRDDIMPHITRIEDGMAELNRRFDQFILREKRDGS